MVFLLRTMVGTILYTFVPFQGGSQGRQDAAMAVDEDAALQEALLLSTNQTATVAGLHVL